MNIVFTPDTNREGSFPEQRYRKFPALESLTSLIDDPGAGADPWAMGTCYEIDDIVTHSSKVWRAIEKDLIDGTPQGEPTDTNSEWVERKAQLVVSVINYNKSTKRPDAPPKPDISGFYDLKVGWYGSNQNQLSDSTESSEGTIWPNSYNGERESITFDIPANTRAFVLENITPRNLVFSDGDPSISGNVISANTRNVYCALEVVVDGIFVNDGRELSIIEEPTIGTIKVSGGGGGGGLSPTLLAKLNEIEAGAEVNVQPNWDESDSTSDAFIQNKPDSFAVSQTGILDAVKSPRDRDDRGLVIGTGDPTTLDGEDQLQLYDVVKIDQSGGTGVAGFANPTDLGPGYYFSLETFVSPGDQNRVILHQKGYNTLAYKEGGGARVLAEDSKKRIDAIGTPTEVTRTWRRATQLDQYNHWGVYSHTATSFTEPTGLSGNANRPYHERFYYQGFTSSLGATVTLYVSVPKGFSSDDVRVRLAADLDTPADDDVLFPSGAQTWVPVTISDFWGADASIKQNNLEDHLAPGADYYKLSARVTFSARLRDGFGLEIADRSYTYSISADSGTDQTARDAAAANKVLIGANTDAVNRLTHLTRDLHISSVTHTWTVLDDNEVDLFWTVPINGEITLTDANFNGNGAEITIPATSSPRTTYVFARFTAGTDVSALRMYQGANYAPGNVWGRAEDEGVTIPSGTTYDYWMTVINLNETAAETWTIQRRSDIDHTRYDGTLGDQATQQILDEVEPLQHLTRDLHVNDDPPAWEDAPDGDGDLFQILDPGSAITLTDANFNGNGSTIQIPVDQEAKTIIFARLPTATDPTSFRVTFDGRRAALGNTWQEKTGPTPGTYKYYRVAEVDNYGNSIVQLEKHTGGLAETRYTGEGSVPAGGVSGQVLAKVSADDYDIGWTTAPMSNSSGDGGSTATPTVLYEDTAAHTWDHDGFRNITLSQAPTAGTMLQFSLKSAPNGIMANTIYMSSDAFLALEVPDTGATGYNSAWPSPGNKAWLGVAPAAVDTAARITYTVGGNEWSHLTFLFVRRQSDTSMDVLYTFDGVDRSATLKIEEMPNGSASGGEGSSDIPTVLAGTREPRPSDGSDGDFWVYGGDNGSLLSISENVEGTWVEIGRATDDVDNVSHLSDNIADLHHLTRDLHSPAPPNAWEDSDDSDGDMYQALASSTTNLTDANFNNQGASLTISTNASTQVYVRLPIAEDHTDYRIVFSDGFSRSREGHLWTTPSYPAATSTTYQYWRADGFTNYGDGEVKLQKRESVLDVTTYTGGGSVPVGGSSGQVLSKASADDYDLEWTTASAGGGGGTDATARSAAAAAQSTADAALSRSGGTMTGKITLDGAPTVDLHAATKKYVDDNIGSGGDGDSSGGGPGVTTTVLHEDTSAPTKANDRWTLYSFTDPIAETDIVEITFHRGANATQGVVRFSGGSWLGLPAASSIVDNGQDGTNNGVFVFAVGNIGDATSGSISAQTYIVVGRKSDTEMGVLFTQNNDDNVLVKITKTSFSGGSSSGGGGEVTTLFIDEDGTNTVNDDTWRSVTLSREPIDNSLLEITFGVGGRTINKFLLSAKQWKALPVLTATGGDSTTQVRNSVVVFHVTPPTLNFSVNADEGYVGRYSNTEMALRTDSGNGISWAVAEIPLGGGGSSSDGGDGDFLTQIGQSAMIALDADTVADTGIDMPDSVGSDEVWAVKVGNERYDDLAFFFPTEIVEGDGAEIGDTLDPNTNAGDSAGATIRAKRGNSTQNDTILLAQDSNSNIVISSSHSNLDPIITLYRVNVGGSGGSQLKDFDSLPDVASYEVGDLVAVDDNWYKLGTTDETTPNLFAGDVGRDVFNTTAGERWRGISSSQSPNGFSTDGEFTANPNNTLTLLLASSSRHIRVAMKRSVYEAAKGSTFSPSDHIAIRVTMADGSTTDEAVLAYYNSYERETNYIIWQHRHASDNYNLYSEAAGNAITIEFFTTSGSTPAATTTPLFTHAVSTKHWLLWPGGEDPTEDGRTALNLAQANAARLDALDMHVDGVAEPIHSQVYDENTALLAPLAGNAGAFAVSQSFSNILTDDLIVVDWTRCEHLNHHDENVVPGSTTDSGRMYMYPRNFDNTEWDGEFVYALDRAIQNNGSADTLNSWIVGAIVFSGSTLTFGLHLQQGGTRTNRNLKPQPGFRLSMRIYRNTALTISSSSPFKGIELGRLVGHDSNHLGEQPWTSLATGVTTTDGPGTGYSHWLSIPMLNYITFATGTGIILEMSRTGVTTQFSQVFIPWHAVGNWDSRGTSYPMFGGSWKSSGTSNNDRIEVRGRINNGRIDLQAACGGADDEGTLHAYIAT